MEQLARKAEGRPVYELGRCRAGVWLDGIAKGQEDDGQPLGPMQRFLRDERCLECSVKAFDEPVSLHVIRGSVDVLNPEGCIECAY